MKAYEWILYQYKELEKKKFYGKLIVEFRDGKLILLRLEETKLPPNNLE